jgi:hypothetical protein
MSAANRGAIVVAIALAACGRGAHFSDTDPARGASGGTGTLPDAGSADGGLVDGGTLPDGGNLSCTNRSDLVAVDGCSGGATQPGAAPASITSAACKRAFFFVSTTATLCTVDTISGPLDAFTGATCTTSNGTPLSCSAPNGILPGVITCAPSNCTIRVCIQGQDGGC